MVACKSPRGCFNLKKAFVQGWIEYEEGFADMVKKRNLTTLCLRQKVSWSSLSKNKRLSDII